MKATVSQTNFNAMVFVYHNLYMKVRDRMIDMEKKAHFMNAATGRA